MTSFAKVISGTPGTVSADLSQKLYDDTGDILLRHMKLVKTVDLSLEEVIGSVYSALLTHVIAVEKYQEMPHSVLDEYIKLLREAWNKGDETC